MVAAGTSENGASANVVSEDGGNGSGVSEQGDSVQSAWESTTSWYSNLQISSVGSLTDKFQSTDSSFLCNVNSYCFRMHLKKPQSMVWKA